MLEAKRLLDAGDDAAAHRRLQEKAVVLEAMAKANQRKTACLSLAIKLEDLIGAIPLSQPFKGEILRETGRPLW